MDDLNNRVLKVMSDCLIKIDFYNRYRQLCSKHHNEVNKITLKKDEIKKILKNTDYEFKYISREREFLYIRKLKEFNLKFMLSSRSGWIIPHLLIDLINEDNLYLVSNGYDFIGEQFKSGYRDSIITNPWPQCTSVEECKMIIEECLAIFKEIEKYFINEFGVDTNCDLKPID